MNIQLGDSAAVNNLTPPVDPIGINLSSLLPEFFQSSAFIGAEERLKADSKNCPWSLCLPICVNTASIFVSMIY